MTPEIKLKVYTQGGEETEIETPSSMPTSEFVGELASALDLPARDAAGHAVSWRLDNKDTGRTLDPQRTLEQNGVQGGHRLSLIREVTAGAGSRSRIQIAAPSGHVTELVLPDDDCDSLLVSPSILQAFGYKGDPILWNLARSSRTRLVLVRTTIASGGFDPKQNRLRAEYDKLMTLNRDSDWVEVRATERPGTVPEEYEVVFKCRGIVGIDARKLPKYSDRHVVKIACGEEFPMNPPALEWQTPIWHPNIHHVNKAVCINRAEWLGGMYIYDLCRQLFDMVQYKNYHADDSPPFPLDREVAEWVRSTGQPNGIVDKNRGIYVDNRPFTRPSRVRLVAAAAAAAQSSQPSSVVPPPSGTIRIVRKVQ